MKRFITIVLMMPFVAMAWAQSSAALDQLKTDPRKAYGTDYPYSFETQKVTKAPSGYKPFYISHYGRHGSRYYWNAQLYREMETLLTEQHNKKNLTPEGEAFYQKFMVAKDELANGVSELSDLGWEQHQRIARIMYNSFPEVFKKGGNVYAISSLTGRCVLSMASFCSELTQCNPKIEIRQESARKVLDGVKPDDRQNPVKHKYPRARPRFEDHRDMFHNSGDTTLRKRAVARVFINTDSLPGRISHIGSNLINLYTSLPSIGHEGMMGNIITDVEIANQWENENLGSYTWVFEPQYDMIPILRDIIKKADAKLNGSSDLIADLRFGHDTCLGPLTVLMGINGADIDPIDPNEVKNCYQNWETGKASNLQLIFYRGKKASDDILVKALLNGIEATLPLPSQLAPYYKWSDFRKFYLDRCDSIKDEP